MYGFTTPKKKQFLRCLGLAEPEEILPIEELAERRNSAIRKSNWLETFLYTAYIFFRRSQDLGMRDIASTDPGQFWMENRGRMRAWTLMGSSLHFIVLYVAAIASFWWPQALVVYAMIYVLVLNAAFAVLLARGWA